MNIGSTTGNARSKRNRSCWRDHDGRQCFRVRIPTARRLRHPDPKYLAHVVVRMGSDHGPGPLARRSRNSTPSRRAPGVHPRKAGSAAPSGRFRPGLSTEIRPCSVPYAGGSILDGVSRASRFSIINCTATSMSSAPTCRRTRSYEAR